MIALNRYQNNQIKKKFSSNLYYKYIIQIKIEYIK